MALVRGEKSKENKKGAGAKWSKALLVREKIDKKAKDPSLAPRHE